MSSSVMDEIELIEIIPYDPLKFLFEGVHPLNFMIYGKNYDELYEYIVNNQNERIMFCGKPKVFPRLQEVVDYINSFVSEKSKITLDVPFQITEELIEKIKDLDKISFVEMIDLDPYDEDLEDPFRKDEYTQEDYARGWYHDDI